MSKELTLEQARELQDEIRSVLNCFKTLAEPLKDESTKYPSSDLPSTVTCKIKASDTHYETYVCGVIDGSICPLNLPIDIVEFFK